MKYKYKVNGLDCANCTQKLEDALNKKEEINDCVISFATGMMTFESNQEINDNELLSFMQSIEDEVTIDNLSTNKTHHHDECSCGHHHEHKHHHHDECGCGQHHEHEHHHDECGCGHHHEHVEDHRELANSIKFNIVGLDCANCASKVEAEIKKQSYIEDAVVNFSTQKLMVKVKNDDSLMEKLQAVVDSVEEGVVLSKEDNQKIYSKPKLFDLKENMELVEGVIIFIGAHFFAGGFATFLYLFAYLLIGYKVILKAIKNIGRKDFLDENFLMCLATFGAIALGDYSEAIAVMLFYAIGEIFQGYAVNKTRSSISSLMDIKSEYATIVKDDQMIQVTPEEVQVGDTIVVKVGEKVPLDGKVIKGNSMLDTASLTGESVPRSVEVGDEVLSGVVNLNDVIYIEVTKPYADSTVSRIIDLVENSASKKAKIEKFITRFAKVYTPTVVGLAVLLLIVPMIILPNQNFYDWLYRACTFLVVSCPCALVISVPLGLYAGIGKASALGVLVKGGNYLELLKDIDKVKVLVDNEIAIENLTKFAGVRHYQIVTGDDGDDFYAIIAKEGIDEELDFNEKSGDVVVISSKTMGSNEELGAVLMKSFIFALTKQDQLPKEMIFYNEGIFLTTNEGDILNDLKYLESQGVDIVSCGTCLDFFNRKELLQVGAVTNMYDIVERMEKAEKVIKP